MYVPDILCSDKYLSYIYGAFKTFKVGGEIKNNDSVTDEKLF